MPRRSRYGREHFRDGKNAYLPFRYRRTRGWELCGWRTGKRDHIFRRCGLARNRELFSDANSRRANRARLPLGRISVCQCSKCEVRTESLYSNRTGRAANGPARRLRRSTASTMRCIACFARLEDVTRCSFSPNFLRLNTGSEAIAALSSRKIPKHVIPHPDAGSLRTERRRFQGDPESSSG